MKNIDGFLKFAESLKLVRKAEIELDEINIIDDIYTDLLPNNGILNKVNLPRTTLLVGRKGTGKSTIFLKSQKDIDQKKGYLSIYIDVKSLYDNSTPSFPDELTKTIESKELNKYLIYANFIREVILKTKEKLRSRVEKKYSFLFIKKNGILADDVYVELDKIESSIDDVFKKLNTSLITSFKNTVDNKKEEKSDKSIGLSIKEGLSGKAGISSEDSSAFRREFDNTMITYLDIKKCLVDNLIKIRDLLEIKYLFIYLDDYSEIDKESQIIFMDWFIAPLNNLSDDFVKFKIATYPKRFYYGKLDNGKIDEIALDFFDAYYSYDKKANKMDISKMESLALDYTSRLLKNRLNIFFPANDWSIFFEIDIDTLTKLLFHVSLNVPRKIGYILSYCYESCLIHKTAIGIDAIESASKRYYNDVIERYFLVNEHICKPFLDKISNEHQYDLLGKIIQRQISNKTVLKKRKNKETSHFYVSSNLVALLDNLELNGFISTYNKVKDDSNNYSTIFSLDFGLCRKYQLTYGSSGTTKLDKKLTNPIYNFNNLIIEYFNSTQVIRCERDFSHEFPYSRIEEFKKFKMACPTCLEHHKVSICDVAMKFQDLKEHFKEQENGPRINVTFQEYLILDNLHLSQKAVSVIRLSDLLDISLTTIKKAVKNIIDNDYCVYDIEVSKTMNTDYVKITAKGSRLIARIAVIIKPKIIVQL